MSLWLGTDGAPVACVEKLKVLAENDVELRTVLGDMFDDAVLMGVDPDHMRRHLVSMVQALPGPSGR